jgi:hypothetical protein
LEVSRLSHPLQTPAAPPSPFEGPDTPRPLVVDPDDDVATDPQLTGGKTASLAWERAAGLVTLPGVVLTTAFCDEADAGATVADHPAVPEALQRIWNPSPSTWATSPRSGRWPLEPSRGPPFQSGFNMPCTLVLRS